MLPEYHFIMPSAAVLEADLIEAGSLRSRSMAVVEPAASRALPTSDDILMMVMIDVALSLRPEVVKR